ncbi:Uncharacterised protein [Mycobacteroides abscessus subsp. abscessus]|nr:Uncharacterised protein [Mycobacteroides abscessus subsp. abscessus]SII85625.1 Uncharacterised protein [Mycobacteroides abscessus subsp. abscessus]SIL59071.1 Uncharacterised protein [Mycobacteroides abscessus subsp. abscessus]
MLDGQPLGEYPELSVVRPICSLKNEDVETVRRNLNALWQAVDARWTAASGAIHGIDG